MIESLHTRALALAIFTVMGLSACSGSDDSASASSQSSASSSSSSSTSSASSSSSSSSSSTSSTSSSSSSTASTESPDLATLTTEVGSKFQNFVYTDTQTGLSLPYNLYIPSDYSSTKSYPLILYIADSSLVGGDVTAPLSQYGALIWASSVEQNKHQTLVLVPEYPSVILDDHGSFTTTAYVELTARFLQSVISQYSVDQKRVYGTGQSMGCMTVMYLAAKYPDLFTAEYFVSGQWDISVLANLATQKFFYITAGGDSRASAGQAEVKAMLDSKGVAYGSGTTTWDATWSAAQFETAAASVFAAGHSINFATFTTGTVLTANSSASSEHMASFEPAYKIAPVRDWLFAQTR